MSQTGIMIYSTIIQLLGLLALLCLVGAAVGIPAGLSPAARSVFGRVFDDPRRPMTFALVIATTAMVGSLYLSEIVGFAPCRMCWYQRFAMYPLVPILAILRWKNRTDLWWVVSIVAVIGASLSAIHIYEQFNPEVGLIPCGSGVPCSARYVAVFGFISIPWLAGSAFLAILTLMLATRALRTEGTADPSEGTEGLPGA